MANWRTDMVQRLNVRKTLGAKPCGMEGLVSNLQNLFRCTRGVSIDAIAVVQPERAPGGIELVLAPKAMPRQRRRCPGLGVRVSSGQELSSRWARSLIADLEIIWMPN
jgi:hypothetical protein